MPSVVHSRLLCASLLLLFGSINNSVAAPDYAREVRWANEVVPALVVGEAMYLTQKNQHKFLGLWSETDSKKMAVIVAHGMGLHPDHGMIGAIRQNLTDYGYSTLSIQMPILAANASYKAYPALFPEAAERLALATKYLKAKGYKKVVIVSHSNGSRMSRVFMATNPKDISAWVALSLTQGDTFKGIKAPVFDLYGANDLEHVLSSTTQRKTSFRNRASQQMLIPKANHFFLTQENLMIMAIKNFLDSL